ncbi:hypothetical protein PG996_007866 [Apiospora saccharicola]|uniref:Uncharacterized protein n=1 Tax=Apiospora saccharicola TaxID=335842 RepID=A0ABR1UZG2_9PEZI
MIHHIIPLKQAIDELASPFRGRKQILPVGAARRIRHAWRTDPLPAHELVAQLLEQAAARKGKEKNKERNRFMEPEGGYRFWRAVRREVLWARELSPDDLILFTSLCALHYIHGDNFTDETLGDRSVKNMFQAAKKWCHLLDQNDLRAVHDHVRRPSITSTTSTSSNSSSSSSSDSDEDTFVSSGEANRLRQQTIERWNALRRFSGDTIVEQQSDQPQPRRGRFLEHFD